MFLRVCAMVLVMACPSMAVAEEAELPRMFYYNPVKNVSIQEKNTTNGQPALRVVFKNSLKRAYVEDNLYIDITGQPGVLVPFKAYEEQIDDTNSWNNSHSADAKPSVDTAAIKNRLSGTIWRLEPLAILPAGQTYRLRIRNTAPPSPPAADAQPGDKVENVTLYQFKTPQKGSSGYMRQLFDPTTWSACDKDC